jgi:hypothetical protein
MTHRQQPLHRRREVPSLHSQITECTQSVHRVFMEILTENILTENILTENILRIF